MKDRTYGIHNRVDFLKIDYITYYYDIDVKPLAGIGLNNMKAYYTNGISLILLF
jgi:hypothetical protein